MISFHLILDESGIQTRMKEETRVLEGPFVRQRKLTLNFFVRDGIHS